MKKLEEEQKKQKEEHEKILRKIEEQTGKKSESTRRAEQEAALCSLRWTPQQVRMGVKLYELTNAVRFIGRTHKTVAPSTLFVLSSAQDKAVAEQRLNDGEFGDFLPDMTSATDFFDNEFYEYARRCYQDILGEEARENELIHLTNAACRFELAAGDAAPILRNMADTSLEEFQKSASMPFADKRRFDADTWKIATEEPVAEESENGGDEA